jgi:hypothetical protein
MRCPSSCALNLYNIKAIISSVLFISNPRQQANRGVSEIMLLLDVSTYKLHEFHGAKIPPYAILSHTWGDDEVTFRDIDERPQEALLKAGFKKISGCCTRAKADGYQWAWVDSCCIDKRSSAELSEAINSMFRWYRQTTVCYVYLDNISIQGMSASPTDEFSKSRWFLRGWTLQELIALKKVIFFSKVWTTLGEKGMGGKDNGIIEKIRQITGIPKLLLAYERSPEDFGAASRIFWAARQVTTRDEDMAYCLMGLFNVHMPIIYGEGLQKAFKRLQWEIIKMSPDETLFAWRAHRETSGLLADSPADFEDSGTVSQQALKPEAFRPFGMTNLGISIETALIKPPEAV